MRRLRFNHAFVLLMLASAISAFALPPNWTDGGRAQLQGLFAPVARPTRALATTIYGRVHHEEPIDRGTATGRRRPDADILLENDQLRLQLTSLQTQLDALKEINADRASLGDIRPLCVPVSVMGSDPGARESLSLSGANVRLLQMGQPVLHARGLVGRIARAGLTGAQVLLITDRESRLQADFKLYRNDASGKITMTRPPLLPLVKGRGRGKMVIDNITMKQKDDAGLMINDTVALNDNRFPVNLQGYVIGKITGIAPAARNPLFAEILIDPGVNLETLREVMVFVSPDERAGSKASP